MPRYAVTLIEGARLFSAADAALEPIIALPEGLALEVVDATPDWIVVLWNGEKAWLPADEAILTDTLPEAEEPEDTEAPGEETPEPTGESTEEEGNGLIIEEEPGE